MRGRMEISEENRKEELLVSSAKKLVSRSDVTDMQTVTVGPKWNSWDIFHSCYFH